MLTCSNFFILFLTLALIYFVSASRKSNVCFLISTSVSVILTFVFYLIITNFAQGTALEFSQFLQTIEYLSVPILNKERISLVYGIWMILFFLVSFTISSIITLRVLKIDNPFLPRSKNYLGSKIMFVIVNTLLFSVLIIFSITNVNILYGMPYGFLSAVFELFEEGVFLL